MRFLSIDLVLTTKSAGVTVQYTYDDPVMYDVKFIAPFYC